MVSALLNSHPGVLSLSEFFVPLGPEAFARRQLDGRQMWRILSRQSPALHAMLKHGHVVDEMLYPLGADGARFRAASIPPIAMVTLPHLTERHEALFDALAATVPAWPSRELAGQYNALFDHLLRHFDRRVWVERSGGSLMLTRKLLRLFPEARVIHVFRDGRDTAMSMAQHNNFRVLVGAIDAARRFGFDPFRHFEQDRGSAADVWLNRIVFTLADVPKLAAGVSPAQLGRFWSELILFGQNALRDLPADRVLPLRFEDLQLAPRETLQTMIRFIDPSLEDEGWLDAAAAVPRPARSKFATLPADEQKALHAACAPGLAALGYD
jgi:hypothetical protein